MLHDINFYSFDKLNFSIQGKGGDIFDVMGKIESIKLKIHLWQNNILKGNFLNFLHLENYIKDCNWENKAPELENRIKIIILDHLQLLSENFEKYFPQKLHQDLENDIWLINLFIVDYLKQENLGNMKEKLLELQKDFSQKLFFRTYPYYGYYWVRFP